MDNIMNRVESLMTPIAMKLDQNKYLSAIKDGFFGVTSILIVGSVFLLFANLPIPGYPEFMAGLFGENWAEFFNIPYTMTMNLMNIYVIIGMARSLARQYKVDDLGASIIALVSFFILTPQVLDVNEAAAIPMGSLGASGLFLGMITAILSTEIYRYVIQRGWVIKFPDTVPSNVALAFSALIPALINILLFNLIRMGFAMTQYGHANEFIFNILQAPLQALGGSVGANVLAMFAQQVLWSFGIHGANIVGAIMNPIRLALTAENANAFQAGQELPHIMTVQFNAFLPTMGGSGATLGLTLLMLTAAKSKQFKTLGGLALGPGIFNINEPIIFGIPIVLNPIMLIPFILVPMISIVLSYFVMVTGLVPLTNGVNLPWTTPAPIGMFLVSGWRGAAWTIILMLLQAGMYYPFFRIVDNRAYILETEGQEGLDERAETMEKTV
ncbi:MAG TPA: PTS sugar transporter subunit IIC [Atopostipes sp.]|nr:PTS sugar transporter subunit IIC [Atopostipes sp.]